MSTYTPPADFSERALVKSLDEYTALYQASIDNPEAFWRQQSQSLAWFTQPTSIYEHPEPGEFEWFGGGKLNVAYNCVDRHAAVTPDKTAIIWAKNEPGEYEHITFADLKARVGRFANLLKARGVAKGDRVCIYLPMIPELAVAMLACARIGAIHSVVFAGFSAEALRDRILDAQSRVLITANDGLRGAKTIDLKAIADDAVQGLGLVDTVLVARRTNRECPMEPGRDVWLDEALATQRGTCPAEWMDAEDPLFILYTSGSTGKPKGLQHTTAGYLMWTSYTHRQVFDAREDDVHFCAADCGWVTGHSYIVYGPLANGVTTVMFESVPTWPDAGRYWQVVDDIGATTLYTAPTALRALMRAGDAPVKRYSRKSLRVLGTVGEPINPGVWEWYHDVVGEGTRPIVDTWWQTETGGTMITPLPGATPTKPGSATLPFPGVQPVLLDKDGNEVQGNGVQGLLAIKGSWPGQARTIYNDHQRFLHTYFTTYPGYYLTGDGARRDEDGYYWITGRVDDVINVSGHRLGTAEVESALVAHDAVAEAAVVPAPHDIKGQGIHAWVTLVDGVDTPENELVGALKDRVRSAIGPIATPDSIRFVPGLPKTRSGKIMRRVLRKLAAGETTGLGDLSTLADPSIIDALIARV
ncbi:MAG: acetyl-CoA synthetase [Myxococcota bacterium]|jgi:acetyl-CoA synthetase